MPPSTESVSTADDNPDRNPLAFQTAIPWVLIGLTPVLMALASWNTERIGTNLQHWIRFFGVPALAVEVVIIILAFRVRFQPLKLLWSLPVAARAALVALIAIDVGDTILVAPDPLRAIFRTDTLLLHIVFGLAAAHLLSFQDGGARWSLWKGIVIGLCGYLLCVIIFVLVMPDPEHFDWLYFGLGVTNVRHAAFFAAVGSAAALALACSARSTRETTVWTAAASAMLGLSFWSGTRGSLLGVWLAFGVALVVFRQLRSARAAAVLIFSTGAGVLLSLIHPVNHHIFGIGRLVSSAQLETLESMSSGRLELWTGTWREIFERPLFGHGQDQLLQIVPEAHQAFFHPHNVLLQLLFQWGFIGAICFVILAVATLGRCYRNLPGDGMLHLPAFMVLTTLLIMSLHDGTLYFSYPLMIVAVSVASMIAGVRPVALSFNEKL